MSGSPSKREALGVLYPVDIPEEDGPSALCLFTRWFPGIAGKFFGRPAWLAPHFPDTVKESLVCKKCSAGNPLTFLCQINTSLANDGLHRALYIFMCTGCRRDFRAVRGFLAKDNPYYFPSGNDTRWGSQRSQIVSKMYEFVDDSLQLQDPLDIEVDDLTEEARMAMCTDSELNQLGLCRICLVPAAACVTEVLSADDAILGLNAGDTVHSWCFKRAHVMLEVMKGHLGPPTHGMPRGQPLGQEMELIAVTRDVDIHKIKLQSLVPEEETRLLDEMNQLMTAEQAQELDDVRKYDEDEAEIQEDFAEELRLRDDGGRVPVIRYDPGSNHIFWMNGHGILQSHSTIKGDLAVEWKGKIDGPKDTNGVVSFQENIAVPDCPHCNSPRRFEVQLYSSVCTYAEKELDVGTLCVFACANDCTVAKADTDGPIEGYITEVCYVQLDDTLVRHKLRPIMNA